MMEAKDDAERREADFKWNVFANDRGLYWEMFEKPREEAEQDIDWQIPKSEADVQRMLEQMKDIPQ